ncbi:MAG: ADP-ribosylation factor-like protein, partial [Promethearchaeota archaeon]
MTEGQLHRYHFKVVVIGDSQVGKTTLIKKFTRGTFDKDYVKTIGAQFSVFDSEIEGNITKLEIWLIGPHEEFHDLYPGFFRETRA